MVQRLHEQVDIAVPSPTRKDSVQTPFTNNSQSMNDFSTSRELIERTIELSRCYAIWWELLNRSNFTRYEQVIQNHEDYFAATTHALFQSIAVISYQLFERRPDTQSIRSAIDAMKCSHPDLTNALTAEIDSATPLLAKLFALRNKVYAHRSKLKSPAETFAEIGLTPDEINTAVLFVRSVVSSLAHASGGITRAELDEEFELRIKYSREDAQLIMRALEKHAP